MLGFIMHPTNTQSHKKSDNIWDSIDSLRNLMLSPTVQKVTKTNTGLCYTMTNGETLERIGGTIAWRNNNPGCIRYSKRVVDMGAIGYANGFAIFPNEETGMRAIKSLLLSDAYRDLNISNAITKYAPPHENNTAHYINSVCHIVGVSHNTKLCELTDEQMTHVVYAIRTLEGWIPGIELHTRAPKPEIQSERMRTSIDNTRHVLIRRAYEHTL